MLVSRTRKKENWCSSQRESVNVLGSEQIPKWSLVPWLLLIVMVCDWVQNVCMGTGSKRKVGGGRVCSECAWASTVLTGTPPPHLTPDANPIHRMSIVVVSDLDRRRHAVIDTKQRTNTHTTDTTCQQMGTACVSLQLEGLESWQR